MIVFSVLYNQLRPMRVNVPRSMPFVKKCVPALLFLCVSLSFFPYASSADTTRDSVAAARLNNTGVALMNQQLLEKALAKFDEAHKLDPTSAVPILNQGIALLYLRKL